MRRLWHTAKTKPKRHSALGLRTRNEVFYLLFIVGRKVLRRYVCVSVSVSCGYERECVLWNELMEALLCSKYFQ